MKYLLHVSWNRMKLLMASMLFMGLGPLNALAFPGTAAPEAAIKPCLQDYKKLIDGQSCPKTAHEQTELDCLLTHEAKLSQGCKTAIASKRQEWRAKSQSFTATKQACKAEVEQLAIADKPQKAAMVSFMMNKEKISQACKAAINKHINSHLSGLRPLD